jgi:hypothetical protein
MISKLMQDYHSKRSASSSKIIISHDQLAQEKLSFHIISKMNKKYHATLSARSINIVSNDWKGQLRLPFLRISMIIKDSHFTG